MKNSLTCGLFQDRGQHHMLNYTNFNLIHHIIRNSFRSHHKKGKLELIKQKTLSLNSLFVHGIHAQCVCGQMRNLFNSFWVKYWKLSNVLLLLLLYLFTFEYDFDSLNHWLLENNMCLERFFLRLLVFILFTLIYSTIHAHEYYCLQCFLSI